MKNLMFTVFLLAASLVAHADLTVTVPTTTATPGQTIYLPVKLYGASSAGTPIAGCEIYLSFNNTVLTNGSLVNFNSGMTGQWYWSVNTNGNGIISANWVEQNNTAIPIPDGTTLFEIKFTYVGGTSPLTFLTTGYPETIFLDANFNLVPFVSVNGSVGPPMANTYTWTGATSTDWTVSTNWNPARTSPAITDILQFNGGGSVPVTNIPTETIGKLSLSNNTQVTITANDQAALTIAGGDGTDLVVPSGCMLDLGGPNPANPIALVLSSGTTSTLRGWMTVSGNFANNAGGSGFVVQSDASGSGSLITLGTAAGTTNVERYLGANAWHYLSSPVANATSGLFVNDYLRTSDPSTANGWGAYITSLTATLEPARGYAAWLPTATETKTFSGTLNTGAVSISLSRNASDPHAGWHMVGNPYPSAIDLTSAGISWGKFEHTAWFWNGSQYETYPVLGGYGTHSQVVPAAQSFYAHIASGFSGATGFSFENTARLHSAVAYLKETPANLLAFQIAGTLNGYTDKAVVRFMDATTAGYDPGYDAKKFFGIEEAPQIYSILPDEIVTVNALPWAGKNTDVPLGFTSGVSDAYTINFSELRSFQSGITIQLEDKKENRTQDIIQNPVFQFSYIVGEEPARFMLHFVNSSIGIPESDGSGLTVYASGTDIYIRSNGSPIMNGEVYVFDLTGRIVYNALLHATDLQKMQTGLQPGYYVVRVISDTQTLNRKVYLQ